jgi:hypothetical protein
MTTTQPSQTQNQTNFNQPQSLVKYSNPVLVSTAGKKQAKVYPFNKIVKNKSTKYCKHLHRRYSKFNFATPLIHNRETAIMVLFIYLYVGYNQYQQPLQLNKMS